MKNIVHVILVALLIMSAAIPGNAEKYRYEDTSGKKSNTNNIKIDAKKVTIPNAVENTKSELCSSLFAKRKNVVSIPQVRMTRMSAV